MGPKLPPDILNRSIFRIRSESQNSCELGPKTLTSKIAPKQSPNIQDGSKNHDIQDGSQNPDIQDGSKNLDIQECDTLKPWGILILQGLKAPAAQLAGERAGGNVLRRHWDHSTIGQGNGSRERQRGLERHCCGCKRHVCYVCTFCT